MAQPTPSHAHAPSPDHPGAGRRAAGLPRDPGRATELLYRRHGNTVFRYAWHLLGRREDAEDATQATFLAVHGALGGGTAVLEPSAWVMRIARNECMGRLRQRARTPGSGSLEAFDPPAVGGVESSAELRDQMRVARHTLRTLSAEEREAFVLREWLGLDAAEAALTMHVSPAEIESLAGRARRSLVLAVGGLEAPVGCAGTRSALETGALDRAGKVHLIRCPVCRGVRRALRAPEETVGSRIPIAIIGERLADALPGFASGGGGIVAILTAKAAAAPVLAKTAGLVAAALLTAGVADHAIQSSRSSRPSAAHAQPRGGEAKTSVSASGASPVQAVQHVHAPAGTTPDPTLIVETRVPAAAPAVRGGAADAGPATPRHPGTSGPGHQGQSGDGSHAGDGTGKGTDGGTGGGEHGDDGSGTTPTRTATIGSKDKGTSSGPGSTGDHSSKETEGGDTSTTSTTSGGSKHRDQSDDGGSGGSAGTGSIGGDGAAGTTPSSGGDGASGAGKDRGGQTDDGAGDTPAAVTTAPISTAPVTTSPVTTTPVTTTPDTTTQPTTTQVVTTGG